MTDSAELAPIREAVRALCADFPGEYWRRLDRDRAYPEAFVVDVAAPNYTGPQWTGCGAGSFPPEAQLDITGDLPESVRAPFTGPTALQFVYDATTHEVVVFVAR